MQDLAEDQTHGTIVEWPAPPNVQQPIGQLPFCAPSSRGEVWEIKDGRAFVRFLYKNPTGGMSWSDPIEVLPGQVCTVVSRRVQ